MSTINPKITISEMVNKGGAIHVRYYNNGCDVHTIDEEGY